MIGSQYKWILLIPFLLPGICNADIIYSAISVNGPPTSADTFGWNHTIDQSGLSTMFNSGVDNFEDYVALAPTHANASSSFAQSAHDFATDGVELIFDLGATQNVSQLAFWNFAAGSFGMITDFDVATANVSDFSAGVTALGSFQSGGGAAPISLEVFDLTDTNARYVRITVTNTFDGFNMGLSEVAFGIGTGASQLSGAVPEPGSAAILSLVVCMTFIRRRRQ
jgi:hypothetical protein